MSKPITLEWDELEAILTRARSAPLTEEDYQTLHGLATTVESLTRELEKKRTSIKRLRALLFGPSTEKSADVLKKKQPSEQLTSAPPSGTDEKKKRKGHGRNGAADYSGAKLTHVPHPSLKSGDNCPESDCTGKIYAQRDPGVIVRIQGRPPLDGTVYQLDKFRCALCGTVFTAPAPEGIGETKYDETVASMVANLKYGAGFPFYRLETLQANLGIPLPASTQWLLVEKAAQLVILAYEALMTKAAQGEVLHNDDTPMKILELIAENLAARLAREGPERTGMNTTGIISKCGEHCIALFFTGRNHAGENLTRVLARRAADQDAPIQMCDALSRNLPREFETILSNCLSHGRRKFVEVVDNFPEECRYVLESLAAVYVNDAKARKEKLSPQQRLQFHQTESGPLMEDLKTWLERQFSEKRVEPNSGLGEAISYMLKRWDKFTLFLREPGAPLDNNICERALKKAILHRKNSLFYLTLNGARVGDIFMSLIHTAELNEANPFDYLCALLRNAKLLAKDPTRWFPWNYQQTLEQIANQQARPTKLLEIQEQAELATS